MENAGQSPSATLDSVCDSFFSSQPAWVQGSLTRYDARFLFKCVLESGTDEVVEIGTASGFSSALLCCALSTARDAGLIGEDFRVVTYDMTTRWHRDRSRRVGDAARVQLSPELLSHLVFRNPAMAAEAKCDYADKDIKFLFIDANHRHPWPTLDLLVLLDCLKRGGTVMLHDINLPLVIPEFADWGAKYLFDDLVAEKYVPVGEGLPNIGRIKMPEDKVATRAQLIRILGAHLWQAKVPPEYLQRIGVPPP